MWYIIVSAAKIVIHTENSTHLTLLKNKVGMKSFWNLILIMQTHVQNIKNEKFEG